MTDHSSTEHTCGDAVATYHDGVLHVKHPALEPSSLCVRVDVAALGQILEAAALAVEDATLAAEPSTTSP